MITLQNLPRSFVPFQQMTVCSNTIGGPAYLVSIGDVLPILVGQGAKPLVWLQAATDPKAKNFVTVVDASISKHPAIRVFENNGEISVKAGTVEVLRVKQLSTDSIVIEKLDLRPLGLNIFGDESQLTAGGMTFSHSAFVGVQTMIGFAPPA